MGSGAAGVTVLLTGPSGAGKTSTLQDLAASRPGFWSGVIAESVLSADGLRVGLAARLLPGETRVDLAVRGTAAAAPPDSFDTPLGPWRFSSRAITAVNDHLATVPVLAASLIDEIGPLELRRGGGFLPGFRTVLAGTAPMVVVVRPDLVDELRRSIAGWSSHRRGIHTVTIEAPSERASAATAIQGFLSGRP